MADDIDTDEEETPDAGPALTIGPARRVADVTGVGMPTILSRDEPKPTAPPPAPMGSVDALAPEAGEVQDNTVKESLPALDAQNAQAAQMAKEQAELAAATEQAKQNRKLAQAQAYFANAFGHPEQAKAILAKAEEPLTDYMANRQQLAEIEKTNAERKERARQEQLNDPDSDLSKTSALALRANNIYVPKGYTASMYNQFLELSKLSGEQQKNAAQQLIEEAKAREEKRSHRANEAIERDRVAAEREARIQAAEAPSKAEATLQTQRVEAYNKAKRAENELNQLIDAHGNTNISQAVLGRVQQLRHDMAVAAVQAKSRPGQTPRPTAVEEELALIPHLDARDLLTSRQASKDLLRSYTKDLGAEAGVQEEADPIVETRGNLVKRASGKIEVRQ